MKRCEFALHLVEVSKSFRGGIGHASLQAVNGLNLTVSPGEIFGVLGPNGAGKSTVFRICMGLIRPTRGEGWIYNRPIGTIESLKVTGYLPDHPACYGYLSAKESLAMAGRLGGVPTHQLDARVDELLVQVGLHAVRNRQLREFSKGMLQRIGIGQAIVHDPSLLILDEPMSGLDPLGRAQMTALLLDLKRRGKTILVSTHLLEDVEALCDRVGLLHRGRLIAVSRAVEFLQRKDSTPESDLLLSDGLPSPLANVIARYVRDDERCAL
jgi:ABC-2 type transport system ATP-binding protein